MEPVERFVPRLRDSVVADAAGALRDDGWTRIADFLAPTSAQALHAWLDAAEWQKAVTFGELVADLVLGGASAIDEAKQALLLAAAHRRAVEGFQFAYDNVRVSDDPTERQARDRPIDRLLEAWNTAEGLALFRTLAGEPGITSIDGRATRYRPGDFLTRHNDQVGKRHTAYVLGLSPEWRPDWGGLLLLHDLAGGKSDALHPQFNTLTLFRVPRDHSVSLVAPFAPVPRYAFTGWCYVGG
jgi:Rps23 Pro-64 3,4-dihydroxylase Tpa1-like proline 4-hydroxylase